MVPVGGPMIATGLLVPLALLLAAAPLLPGPFPEMFREGLAARWLRLGVLAAGALAMLLLGMADDRRALGAGTKLSIQFLVALGVSLSGTRISLFMESALPGHALTILWILLLVNAYNLSDNMDGLCAGLSLIAILTLSLHAALPGHYLVAAFGFLCCGALAGFLPCNFPAARAFLGDAGSHLAGYLVALLTILPHFRHQEDQGAWAVLVPLPVTGIVLLDMVWVVVRRLYRARPVWVGDTGHLSHQLVRRGLSRRGAVTLLWLAQGALAALSFLLVG